MRMKRDNNNNKSLNLKTKKKINGKCTNAHGFARHTFVDTAINGDNNL